MDRESYLDAWSGTNDNKVLEDTGKEILRFGTFKGKTFKESLEADREGVRLALLCAESWYEGSECAQVGKEKRHAASMYKQIHGLRVKMFGKTVLESMIKDAVVVPIHRVKDLKKSGLTPVEFADALKREDGASQS